MADFASNATPSTVYNVGVVNNVILNEEDELIDEIESDNDDIETKNLSLIGAIKFRLANEFLRNKNELYTAYPLDRNLKNIPIKNEIVQIENINGIFYYKTLIPSALPNVNNTNTNITSISPVVEKSQNSPQSYSSVRNTGISNTTNVDNEDGDNSYGEYFTANPNIHLLRLYEGDSLIESRFGQSIRFSAYNNVEREESPTIIIRNGESGFTQNNVRIGGIVEEDINRDGTTIVMGSNRYKLDFQPGTLSDRGATDFKTKPRSFQNYPTDLTGDQLLMSSGRMIFSTRESEMIFYSKKNYGFISDGGMSIDNKGGIIGSIGGDFTLSTNNKNINFNTGTGNINLGDGRLEPLVKGDTLAKLLNDMLSLIRDLGFGGVITPSGVSTGLTPPALNKLTNIQLRVNQIKSNFNNTQ